MTRAQRKVLEAARDERLKWFPAIHATSVAEYRYSRPGEDYVSQTAGRPTIAVLVRNEWIEEPRRSVGSWSAVLVQITEKGKEALS